MKTLVLLFTIMFTTIIHAETSCEKKMKKLILTSDQINFKPENELSVSNFKFKRTNNDVEGSGMVLVYNGDTHYALKGFILPYGQDGDCVITEIKINIVD